MQTKYWIPQDKKVLRNIIYNCAVCTHFSCVQYQYPETPPLLTDRVLFQYPFYVSNVDCLGPTYVKDVHIESTDSSKSWISLFTCVSSRAMHLEFVVDSTGPSFINATGSPKKIISDNSSNYTSNEL